MLDGVSHIAAHVDLLQCQVTAGAYMTYYVGKEKAIKVTSVGSYRILQLARIPCSLLQLVKFFLLQPVPHVPCQNRDSPDK